MLENLPTYILLALEALERIGLLSPGWPNPGNRWATSVRKNQRTDLSADRGLSDIGKTDNAMLSLNLEDKAGEEP